MKRSFSSVNCESTVGRRLSLMHTRASPKADHGTEQGVKPSEFRMTGVRPDTLQPAARFLESISLTAWPTDVRNSLS